MPLLLAVTAYHLSTHSLTTDSVDLEFSRWLHLGISSLPLAVMT